MESKLVAFCLENNQFIHINRVDKWNKYNYVYQVGDNVYNVFPRKCKKRKSSFVFFSLRSKKSIIYLQNNESLEHRYVKEDIRNNMCIADLVFDEVVLEKCIDGGRFYIDVWARYGDKIYWIEVINTANMSIDKINYCLQNDIELVKVDIDLENLTYGLVEFDAFTKRKLVREYLKELVGYDENDLYNDNDLYYWLNMFNNILTSSLLKKHSNGKNYEIINFITFYNVFNFYDYDNFYIDNGEMKYNGDIKEYLKSNLEFYANLFKFKKYRLVKDRFLFLEKRYNDMRRNRCMKEIDLSNNKWHNIFEN